MEIAEENSTYTTSIFLTGLEDNLGFKVDLVQTDNGKEFVSDPEQTSKKSRFEKFLKNLGIRHHRIRPYSPWQNGIVERIHRIDNELFYNKRRFKGQEEMIKSFEIYSKVYRKRNTKNPRLDK